MLPMVGNLMVLAPPFWNLAWFQNYKEVHWALSSTV